MATPTIELWRRPPAPVIDEIVELAKLFTGKWFTDNVPEDTRRDLLFQDVLCLRRDGVLAAFLVFTSTDGSIYVTLIATHPQFHGQGFGSQLMEYLFQHVRGMGFTRVVAMTVPPEVNPAYAPTLAFYNKHGFVLTRHYHELWENGALELVKTLD